MTTAVRDGGSARDLGSVMMRHGSSLVSVGAVRPPVAPAEPPSVAAVDLQGCAYLQASVRTLPGHARPGRRHIYSPAGYSHGLRPTGVYAPFASLHRLSVQQSRVIVSAQGTCISAKEADSEEGLSLKGYIGKLPGRVARPVRAFVGRVDAASTCVGEKALVWVGPESPAHVAASTLPTTGRA